MIQTLFGVVESKAEARERARRLVQLHGAVADAPELLECRRDQVETLDYFIERSDARKFDPNDWDGLMRNIDFLGELLTERDERALRRDRSIWRYYRGNWRGWGFASPNAMFRIKLHRKERAYLVECRREMEKEMAAVEEGLPGLRQELAELAAVAPLPEDIARRYALTTDGQPARKASP